MTPSDAEAATLDERVRARSAARRADRRHETKQAILDAATELFEASGRDTFSLRQVAAAIGYSATTIYNYFDDKDDLLHHVVLEGFGEFGVRLQEAYEAGRDPADRLDRLGAAYVRFGLERPLHYRLMFMERCEFLEREPPSGYERPIDSFGFLRRSVEECVDAGIFPERDPLALAMQFWCIVHGVASMAIATPYLAETDTEGLRAFTYEAMMRGMEVLAREPRRPKPD